MNTNTYQEISVKEAADISGLSERWIKEVIREKKAFSACKPFGSKNGWRICKPSFEQWLRKRRYETTNTVVGRIK